MKTIHFVTGATGFVGSNLVLELLGQAETEVYALVRAAEEPSEFRLQSALRHAARAAGCGNGLDQTISSRVPTSSGMSQLPCAMRTATPPRSTGPTWKEPEMRSLLPGSVAYETTSTTLAPPTFPAAGWA